MKLLLLAFTSGKWNVGVNGSKSIRSEPNHSRAIVITNANVLCCCCCSNYLLAINLHITATLRTSGSLNIQTLYRTRSHFLYSLETDVDTDYLKPKVSSPNGLVRSGDRYRDGDLESAREWFKLLLSCLCLSSPSHIVDRSALCEERSPSVRPGISSSSIRVKLM